MPRHFLLVDIGNTYLKWALSSIPNTHKFSEPYTVLNTGKVLLTDIESISSTWCLHPIPKRIIISNVAGPHIMDKINLILPLIWPNLPPCHWVKATRKQCNVTNYYEIPHTLGSDRWASLIAAKALVGDKAVLTIGLGTATTLDFLTKEGYFLGGCILPGENLMYQILDQKTFQLTVIPGSYQVYPQHTGDAIKSGCLEAQIGAIERRYHLYAEHHSDLACILSGGGTCSVREHLRIPFLLQEDLVLRGLHEIGISTLVPFHA